MTLAKTCHASNNARLGRSNSYCDHKSCLNRDVSIVPLLNWKKIESHFETWSSDGQRINLTFVVYSFVANFVRYISAKYYLNWFSFHTVIMKVLGELFFETQCIFNSFPVIRTASAKNRRFHVPQPTFLFPWIIRQYVARMERKFDACQMPRSMYLSILNSFRAMRWFIQCVTPKIGIFYHIFTARCEISAVYALTPCLSVRLSVRPSATFVDHVKTNKDIFEIFSPCGSIRNGVALFQGEPP